MIINGSSLSVNKSSLLRIRQNVSSLHRLFLLSLLFRFDLAGRIWNHRRGGGDKKVFRMIAWARGGSADAKKPEVEVVKLFTVTCIRKQS